MRTSLRSTNENNFSARRIQLSSIRRAKAPNFLGWNSTSSRRRADGRISGSLKCNKIATGHVQSYLWSIATDFVGPPIPFRPFNAFAPLAFPDSRYIPSHVQNGENFFELVPHDVFVAGACLSRSKPRINRSSTQISSDTLCQRCADLKPIEQARTTNRYPLLFTTSIPNKKSMNLDRTIHHPDITFERNLTMMYNSNPQMTRRYRRNSAKVVSNRWQSTTINLSYKIFCTLCTFRNFIITRKKKWSIIVAIVLRIL